MMTLRRTLIALALLPVAAGLVSCSSTTGGAGHTQSAPGLSGSPGGQPAGTADFIARFSAAVRGVTSVHVTAQTAVAGSPTTVVGDETLSAGTLTGYQFTDQLPGGTGQLKLLYAGGKTYAQLPPSLNQTGKPWVLVSATSSNQFARILAGTIEQLQGSASVAELAALGTAATNLKVVGDETVNGVPSTHYSFVVDVAKLPNTFPGKSTLQQAGLTTIPSQVWLDQQNRPIRVQETVTVSGKPTTTTVNLSDYNKPLTISAPPADQVSTS